MYELEIWGGATAAYLQKFRKRRFRTLDAAEQYQQRINDYLEQINVSAAHPMWITEENEHASQTGE